MASPYNLPTMLQNRMASPFHVYVSALLQNRMASPYQVNVSALLQNRMASSWHLRPGTYTDPKSLGISIRCIYDTPESHDISIEYIYMDTVPHRLSLQCTYGTLEMYGFAIHCIHNISRIWGLLDFLKFLKTHNWSHSPIFDEMRHIFLLCHAASLTHYMKQTRTTNIKFPTRNSTRETNC